MWSLWVVFKSWFLDLRISETIQENVTLRTRQCSFDESKQYLFIYLFGILKFINYKQLPRLIAWYLSRLTHALSVLFSKNLPQNYCIKITWHRDKLFNLYLESISLAAHEIDYWLLFWSLLHCSIFFFHFFSSCLKCSQLLNWFFTHFLCELSLMCTLPIICDFRGYPYPVFLVQV